MIVATIVGATPICAAKLGKDKTPNARVSARRRPPACLMLGGVKLGTYPPGTNLKCGIQRILQSLSDVQMRPLPRQHRGCLLVYGRRFFLNQLMLCRSLCESLELMKKGKLAGFMGIGRVPETDKCLSSVEKSLDKARKISEKCYASVKTGLSVTCCFIWL